MQGFILAWLVGEGIVIYRTVKKQKIPPSPGQLAYTSGLFVLLALLAQSEKARPVAVTMAWGFNIAAFLNLYKPVTDPPPTIKWPPSTMSPDQIFPGNNSSSPTGNQAFGENPNKGTNS